MNQFTLEIPGTLRNGFNPNEVEINLANLFNEKNNPGQVQLQTEKTQKISNLDFFTASQYKEMLYQAGLISNIYCDDENIPEQYPENDCPKCASISISNGQCLDCDVFIDKYWNQQRKTLEKPKESETTILEEDILEQVKVKKWFKTSTIFLSVGFIIDSFLQDSAIMMFILNMDLGLMPFIPGYLSLVYAVYLYTSEKGYEGYINWLGLAFLPGLAIALLLPRQGESFSAFSKTTLLSISILMFSIYYSTNITSSLTIQSQDNTIVQGREMYPSNIKQSDASIFINEAKQTTDYIQSLVDFIAQEDLRNRSLDNILLNAFSAMEDYLAWWEYQRFLNYSDGNAENTSAEHFQDRWRNELLYSWQTIFHEKFSENLDPKLIYKLGQGFNGELDNYYVGKNKFDTQLNEFLKNLEQDFRNFDFNHRMQSNGENTKADLTEFKMPSSKYKIKYDGTYLIISSNIGILKDTPLIFVTYYETGLYGKGFNFQLKRIDSQFPDRRLHSNQFRLLDRTFHISGRF